MTWPWYGGDIAAAFGIILTAASLAGLWIYGRPRGSQ